MMPPWGGEGGGKTGQNGVLGRIRGAQEPAKEEPGGQKWRRLAFGGWAEANATAAQAARMVRVQYGLC